MFFDDIFFVFFCVFFFWFLTQESFCLLFFGFIFFCFCFFWLFVLFLWGGYMVEINRALDLF
ncbi:hypothetical protein EFV17_19880 [Escherichia coli]|nr:hypothetical protein EFV17_19880 [Escherichia coli]